MLGQEDSRRDFVAVLKPGGVGDEDAGVGPAGCAGLGPKEVGGDVGEGVFGRLGVVDVEHELAGEAGDVEVVSAGAPEDAGVTHPAETLVALGTVGGDGEEVSALAPDAEVAHAVEEFAGAGEADGGSGGEAVVDEAFDAGGGGSAGVAGEFDVAEAVEGEGGGVGLVAVAGENVGIGDGRVAEVLGVDAAVGIEALGEAHLHDGAAGAVDVEDDVADHVLAHVVDDGVGCVGGVQGDWVEGVGDGDGEVGLGGELNFGCDGGGNGGGPVGG